MKPAAHPYALFEFDYLGHHVVVSFFTEIGQYGVLIDNDPELFEETFDDKYEAVGAAKTFIEEGA